jgi:hypothetical protein
MRPFEFGASPDDDYDCDAAFDFDTPVGTVNPYALDIRMPAPMRPWRGPVMPPPSEYHSAAASSSGSQQQQQQQQPSRINIDNHDIPLPLQSRYGTLTPGHEASLLHHPILSESQLNFFFPDFSQHVASADNETVLPIGGEYVDQPRREVLLPKSTSDQKISGKHKGRDAKPQTEYIAWPPLKKFRVNVRDLPWCFADR